jgi:hypothetical protein
MKKIYSILALGFAFAWNMDGAKVDLTNKPEIGNLNYGQIHLFNIVYGQPEIQSYMADAKRKNELGIPNIVTDVTFVLTEYIPCISFGEDVRDISKNIFEKNQPSLIKIYTATIKSLLKGGYCENMEENLQKIREFLSYDGDIFVVDDAEQIGSNNARTFQQKNTDGKKQNPKRDYGHLIDREKEINQESSFTRAIKERKNQLKKAANHDERPKFQDPDRRYLDGIKNFNKDTLKKASDRQLEQKPNDSRKSLLDAIKTFNKEKGLKNGDYETLERKSNYRPTKNPFLNEIETFDNDTLKKTSDRSLEDVQPSENSGNDMASILRRAMQNRRNSMEGNDDNNEEEDNNEEWEDSETKDMNLVQNYSSSDVFIEPSYESVDARWR